MIPKKDSATALSQQSPFTAHALNETMLFQYLYENPCRHTERRDPNE
jgi:hypothetical protein